MRFLIFALICLSTVSYSKAQFSKLFYTQEDSIAYSHIQKLKNSVLLVRLRTNHIAIQSLLDQKRIKDAEYLLRKAEEENLSIMRAFNTVFTFCDVHFFLSESSEDVLWRDFEGVFVDEELRAKKGSPIEEYDPFYTLEVGNIYFQTFSETFEGIAVMDEHFKQLKKPFPYYVRKFSGIRVVERTNEDLVLELQKKLDKFYAASLSHSPAN